MDGMAWDGACTDDADMSVDEVASREPYWSIACSANRVSFSSSRASIGSRLSSIGISDTRAIGEESETAAVGEVTAACDEMLGASRGDR